jgi:uncharacterized protein
MKMEKTMRRSVFLLVWLVLTSAAWAQTTGQALSEISVSADAAVTADPDVAEFHISIIVRQEQATESFKLYMNTYNSLQKSLKGITDSTKLLTDNLSVTPYFSHKEPGQVNPDYYQVAASMSLSVPISDLNRVLGSVTSVEGVTINGIEFRTNDREKLEIQALELAVTRAREKAAAIARLEGLSDLRVKSMNTSFNRPPIMPMYGAVAAQMAMPSVNASSVSVSATVQVTYTAASK